MGIEEVLVLGGYDQPLFRWKMARRPHNDGTCWLRTELNLLNPCQSALTRTVWLRLVQARPAGGCSKSRLSCIQCRVHGVFLPCRHRLSISANVSDIISFLGVLLTLASSRDIARSLLQEQASTSLVTNASSTV